MHRLSIMLSIFAQSQHFKGDPRALSSGFHMHAFDVSLENVKPAVTFDV